MASVSKQLISCMSKAKTNAQRAVCKKSFAKKVPPQTLKEAVGSMRKDQARVKKVGEWAEMTFNRNEAKRVKRTFREMFLKKHGPRIRYKASKAKK